MSKKLISLILCGILVFGSFSTCFATSTDSAIKLSSVIKAGEIKANPPDGSSSNPYYINPQSSSGTRYYVNDSSGTVSSSSVYVTTWGDLMNHLTYSISYSIKAVTSRLGTILTNLNTYLNSTSSSSFYYWDWTPSGGVAQGAPESAENIVTALRNIGMQLTKSLSYNTEYTYQANSSIDHIEQIVSDGAISVDIGNSFDWPWGMYNYYIDHPNVTLVRINENGTRYTQSIYTKAQGWFGNMMYFLIENGRNIGNALPLIVADVKNGNNTDVLTNSDLTTTALEHDSMWDDLDHIGANISHHLARLSFVLASDEEIEARQAAATNQEEVVDSFIKPTGSGSASSSDFADIASIGGDMKDALNSNVSPSSAFTSLSSNSDAWNWFSTDTANSLDTTSNQRSSVSSTPLLDNYYSEVLENLRFK